MTSSLKRFRMQTFKDVGVDSDSESNRPESIKKRHKRELQEAERENRENTSALMELRDLEDELKSLERLFEAQDAAVKNMKSIFESEELKMQTRNGRVYLEEALGKLDEYRSQTVEMLKRVDTTRNDVSTVSNSSGSYAFAHNHFTVRETSRNGSAPGSSRRGPLVPPPNRARIITKFIGHDLHDVYRHFSAAILLYGPLRHEHHGLG